MCLAVIVKSFHNIYCTRTHLSYQCSSSSHPIPVPRLFYSRFASLSHPSCFFLFLEPIKYVRTGFVALLIIVHSPHVSNPLHISVLMLSFLLVLFFLSISQQARRSSDHLFLGSFTFSFVKFLHNVSFMCDFVCVYI